MLNARVPLPLGVSLQRMPSLPCAMRAAPREREPPRARARTSTHARKAPHNGKWRGDDDAGLRGLSHRTQY